MSLSDKRVSTITLTAKDDYFIPIKDIKASIKRIKEKLREIMEFEEIGCGDDWESMCKAIDKEMGEALI